MRLCRYALIFLLFFSLSAFAQTAPAPAPAPAAPAATPEEAAQFIAHAEQVLNDLGIKAGRAAWVQETYITDDTEGISADAQAQVTAAITDLATQARRFEGLKLSPELTRKFYL